MKPKVFIPERIAEAGIHLLQSKVDFLAPWTDGREIDQEESRSLLSSSDAVIVRLFKIGIEDLENSPDLKVIAKHGVGVDNIDLRAARGKGVQVVYTPFANSNAVADHTVALLLALARKIEPAARALREGRFNEGNRMQGVELAGKTLGIVGLGRIGKRVAEIAALGLGMRVVAFDPFLSGSPGVASIALCGSVEEVLKQSDFLTLHVPLNSSTRHLIRESSIKLLKPDCRIVNTSRGSVVDEVALARALVEGRIAGAALDVFEEEPLQADHPLCKAPNLLLTPHISSSTRESLDRMAVDAAQGVLDALEGRNPKYPYPLESFS